MPTKRTKKQQGKGGYWESQKQDLSNKANQISQRITDIYADEGDIMDYGSVRLLRASLPNLVRRVDRHINNPQLTLPNNAQNLQVYLDDTKTNFMMRANWAYDDTNLSDIDHQEIKSMINGFMTLIKNVVEKDQNNYVQPPNTSQGLFPQQGQGAYFDSNLKKIKSAGKQIVIAINNFYDRDIKTQIFNDLVWMVKEVPDYVKEHINDSNISTNISDWFREMKGKTNSIFSQDRLAKMEVLHYLKQYKKLIIDILVQDSLPFIS